MNKRFFSVPELAEHLGISKTKMWRLIRDNEIKVMRIGHRVIITEEALNDYVKKNEGYWSK